MEIKENTDFKFLLKDKIYNVIKKDNEPLEIFRKRILFIINALLILNEELISEQILLLSFCYSNIIQYGVEYNKDLMLIIDKINNSTKNE
jgi:hypothetical protein